MKDKFLVLKKLVESGGMPQSHLLEMAINDVMADFWKKDRKNHDLFHLDLTK